MIRKLHTAQALTFQDWWVLAQAWGLLLIIDMGLHVVPYARLKLLLSLGRKKTNKCQVTDASIIIHHRKKCVNMAGRNHLGPMTCFRRSLALQWLLARYGICTDLQIGVCKEGTHLNAHAWLEYNGRDINIMGEDLRHYTPMTTRGVVR